MTIETCGKKNDDGLICERFKGHNGYCKNGNHVYLPGLINQGQTPKRRALFLVVVCLALAFLYSMPLMVFALEGEGLTVAIIMVILLAVMTLIMNIGNPHGFRGIWRDYQQERQMMKASQKKEKMEILLPGCDALDEDGKKCDLVSIGCFEYHGDREIYGIGEVNPTWVVVWLCESHSKGMKRWEDERA
jgi:hypothetical protein